MPIQIIFITLFIFAIIKVVWRFRARDVTWQSMLFWIVFWVGGIVVVSMPDLTFQFARLIGVQRGADAIVYGALTLIFFILFRQLLAIEKLKKEITVLTREIVFLKKANSQCRCEKRGTSDEVIPQ